MAKDITIKIPAPLAYRVRALVQTRGDGFIHVEETFEAQIIANIERLTSSAENCIEEGRRASGMITNDHPFSRIINVGFKKSGVSRLSSGV